MKKERDCNSGMVPYPIYPTYNNNLGMPPGMIMQPNMIAQPNMTMPNYTFVPSYSSGSNNSIEQQLSSMNNQINSLERRVSNLENLIGNTGQYSNSNYQVM